MLTPAAQRYFDLGGFWPVYWAFQCGLDQLYSRLARLNDASETETVIYLFSRMMVDPRGPALLINQGIDQPGSALKLFVECATSNACEQNADSESLAMVAYILVLVCKRSKVVSEYCAARTVPAVCHRMASDGDALSRQWGLTCLAVMYETAENTDSELLRSQDALVQLALDAAADSAVGVRAASLYLLWTVVNDTTRVSDRDQSRHMALSSLAVLSSFIRKEGSSMVRFMFLDIARSILPAWGGLCEAVSWLRQSASRSQDAQADEQGQILLGMDRWLTANAGNRSERAALLSQMREVYTTLHAFKTDPDPAVRISAINMLLAITTRLTLSDLAKRLPPSRIELDHLINDEEDESIGGRRLSSGMDQLQALIDGTTSLSITNAATASQYSLSSVMLAAIMTRDDSANTDYWTATRATLLPPAHYDGPGFAEHSLPALHDWIDISSAYFHQPRLIWANEKVQRTQRQLGLARTQTGEDSAIIMAAQIAKPFSHYMFELELEDHPNLLVFHSYEPILAAASNHHIEVWNTDEQRCMTRYAPSLLHQAAIKSLAFLNEVAEIGSFTLAVALSDGVVKVFHGDTGCIGRDTFRATAAFRSVQYDIPESQVATAWNQNRRQLSLAGSTSGCIQVWDAQQERCTRSIPLLRGSDDIVLTCLDVEQERGNILLGGDSIGNLTMYDQRQHNRTAVKFWESTGSGKMRLCSAGAGLEKEVVTVT